MFSTCQLQIENRVLYYIRWNERIWISGLLGFQIQIKGLCGLNFVVSTCYLSYCLICIFEHEKQWVTVKLSTSCYWLIKLCDMLNIGATWHFIAYIYVHQNTMCLNRKLIDAIYFRIRFLGSYSYVSFTVTSTPGPPTKCFFLPHIKYSDFILIFQHPWEFTDLLNDNM